MFEPFTAFVAGIKHDGTVIAATMLDDPSICPTVVVEFELNEELYRAIYHHSSGVWEFPEWVGSNSSVQRFVGPLVVSDGDNLYAECEETLAKFQSTIFAAPKADRFREVLARRMSKEIMAEIDADILSSLRIAASVPMTSVKPSAVWQLSLGQPAGIEPTRKLKARWTMETTDDVFSMMSLASKIYPDAAACHTVT